MLRSYIFLFIFIVSVADLKAQCWPTGMTHDTRQENQWLSCIATDSPNPQRGKGFWIMYDLGTFYELTTTKVWNFNEPGFIEQGITRLGIDYSLDGTSWKSLPDANLELATGERTYSGQDGPDLDGIVARYVLLTALETGAPNMSCAGLAEVRFDIGDPVNLSSDLPEARLEVFPNPTK
ncbi:MAG: discoidin domain-containing protein, partial [Bacteroidota bacterium]